MTRNSLTSTEAVQVHVTRGFWNTQERPDNILPNLLVLAVPLAPGATLQQVLGGPHSPALCLLYGTASTTTPQSRGIPPPGNLRVFRRAREGEGLVREDGTGLENMSVMDACLRPGNKGRAEQLLIVNGTGDCFLWCVTSRRSIKPHLSLGQLPLRSTFSPDGELLAMSFPDGRIRIWRIGDGAAASENVEFNAVNTVRFGKVREAASCYLSFASCGQVLYMVKIAQGIHSRGRLGVQDQEVRILGSEDWPTVVGTSSGSVPEVCFAGLGRHCYYLRDGQTASKAIALAATDVTFVKHVQFVTAVQFVCTDRPPITQPRGVVIACDSRSVWLTDLKNSDHNSAKILAVTEPSKPEACFHSVGQDGNTLWAVSVQPQN